MEKLIDKLLECKLEVEKIAFDDMTSLDALLVRTKMYMNRISPTNTSIDKIQHSLFMANLIRDIWGSNERAFNEAWEEGRKKYKNIIDNFIEEYRLDIELSSTTTPNFMNEELRRIANKYKLQFYAMWDTKGGNGWIWYKQDDENKFKIQIFTHDNFEVYKNIKTEITNLFLLKKCSLANEVDVGSNIGYRRDLFFMDSEELEKQKRIKENERHKSAIYNIGQINADGGILTFGNVVNSTQSIDNSIQNIKNLIEEKGGKDKEELYSILNEAKEILNTMHETKEIKTNTNFIERLSNHISKHGWFYGAITNLLGTGLLSALGS